MAKAFVINTFHFTIFHTFSSLNYRFLACYYDELQFLSLDLDLMRLP